MPQKKAVFPAQKFKNSDKEQWPRKIDGTVIKRIEDILKVLSATAKGEFSYYCKIKNLEEPDSLDALSIGINIMISDLGSYAGNLRETIAELNTKTEELQKLNKLFVGREMRIIELKKEIEALKKKLEEKKQ